MDYYVEVSPREHNETEPMFSIYRYVGPFGSMADAENWINHLKATGIGWRILGIVSQEYVSNQIQILKKFFD